jgi:hypothetical protein
MLSASHVLRAKQFALAPHSTSQLVSASQVTTTFASLHELTPSQSMAQF